MDNSTPSHFDLNHRVILITGGAGLLGTQHAEAIAEINGVPVLLDIDPLKAEQVAKTIQHQYDVPSLGLHCDVTSEESVKAVLKKVLSKFNQVSGLINNAANNMKMQEGDPVPPTQLEVFPLETWQKDFDVAVTGAFICSRVFGKYMADNKEGVIINISSDLGIIAPDQRIYETSGVPEEEQIVKPVSYSVTKHALIGLTKYLATYWADQGIRVNTLCPGGIFSGQPDELVDQLAYRIPLGRMAKVDEYKGAIQYLCSAASTYMTGSCLVVDGGRTVW